MIQPDLFDLFAPTSGEHRQEPGILAQTHVPPPLPQDSDEDQGEPPWEDLPAPLEELDVEEAGDAGERREENQLALLTVEQDWRAEWRGMPDYVQEARTPYKTIHVHFAEDEDVRAFSDLIGVPLTTERTRFSTSTWYPPRDRVTARDKRWVTPEPVLPRYPIYVVSKGRWESRMTARHLEAMGVPYRIVVEPQEMTEYARVIDPEKVLILPFSNLGLGSIPARNWIWEHAMAEGHERHWILDDNIDGFFRLHHNTRIAVASGVCFRAVEDFTDRYANVALAGLQYLHFAPRRFRFPAYIRNTRVYSCILIRNDLPHRWRGRYNEDTDLSLCVLKDGWATLLFYAFLANKMPTLYMEGGNTDQLYAQDGRYQMAVSLAEQHPDVVNVSWKWHRIQHVVDYAPFRRTKLIRIAEAPEGIQDYGMRLVRMTTPWPTNGIPRGRAPELPDV